MKKKKIKLSHISKVELIQADAHLLPPTQNVEKNLARGEEDLVPDPDDIPGGFDKDIHGEITKRPTIVKAEGQAALESTERKK